MNGNAKWVIGVLGSIAGLAENSGQRQKQSAAAVGSWQCQLPTAAACWPTACVLECLPSLIIGEMPSGREVM